jgi:hypothetical protein
MTGFTGLSYASRHFCNCATRRRRGLPAAPPVRHERMLRSLRMNDRQDAPRAAVKPLPR